MDANKVFRVQDTVLILWRKTSAGQIYFTGGEYIPVQQYLRSPWHSLDHCI